MLPENSGSKTANFMVSLAQALLVTFLWSSSYVLIKIGLGQISPLAFAALRYSLAFIILFLASAVRGSLRNLANLSLREWLKLIIIGAFGYAGAQGLQFVGLRYIPVVATSFLLNFTPVFVVLLGILFLNEIPTKLQAAGIMIALLGGYVYFQTPIQSDQVLGVVFVLASGICWAIYMTLARRIQRGREMDTLQLTTTSMWAGALILLVSSFLIEGIPSVALSGWIIIAWLSLVNTAIAFYLWNQALRVIKAYELSMLQNIMLVETTLLAWIFLNEQVAINMIVGIILVLFGVTLVEFSKRGSRSQ